MTIIARENLKPMSKINLLVVFFEWILLFI
jgi:hypothetical protein